MYLHCRRHNTLPLALHSLEITGIDALAYLK
jgi:hypothetical protein